MKVIKKHSHNDKKYHVIINIDKDISEDEIYPARFKEINMNDKMPKWFKDFSNNLDQRFEKIDQRFEKMEKINNENWKKQMEFNEKIDKRLSNIEGCPTIKKELR